MRSLALSFAAFVLVATASCSKSPTTATTTATASQTESPNADDKLPPFPVVTDDASDLLFSYVDPQGHVVPASKPSDIPDAVKARVLVVDLTKTPEERQAHRYAFFVDLTTKTPEGTYPVTVVSRYDAAKGQVAAPIAPAPPGSVVVYSATWCGFCHKAKAWLKENNVPFIDRDVEKTAGAQDELTQKLKAKNVPPGGIPVIDWDGTLVMGFDKNQLERLKTTHPIAPEPTTPPAP
jgi:glutaredoxin